MTMHSTLAKSSKDASAEGLEMFGSTLATQVKKKMSESSNFSRFAKFSAFGARPGEASFPTDFVFDARPLTDPRKMKITQTGYVLKQASKY